jgi:hypothetical protein
MGFAIVLVLALSTAVGAQVRLADESDRAAFRSWFVLLADAQFERTTADVIDCAALVRHAFREALRAHTPEWLRRSQLPFTPRFADVRSAPRPTANGWPLFRIDNAKAPKYAEFADASTIIRFNSRTLGRTTAGLQPGDLLYFHQPGQQSPDHVMVFIGRSLFESEGDDWVVYHTGPLDNGSGDPSTGSGSTRAKSSGEVRKTRLSTLMQHPAPRWRPVAANPQFVGVFRLNTL